MRAEHSLNVVGRCERTRPSRCLRRRLRGTLEAGLTSPTVRWIPADL